MPPLLEQEAIVERIDSLINIVDELGKQAIKKTNCPAYALNTSGGF